MKELFDKIKGKGTYVAIACISSALLIVLIIGALQPEATTHPSNTDALITTATDDLGNTVTHLYKRYSNNFIADTNIPTVAPESAEIYYASYIDYDEELLYSLFMDGVETERVVTDEGAIFHYEWTDDNKELVSSYLRIMNDQNDVIYRNRAVGDYYVYPADDFHTRQSIQGSVNNLPLYETVYNAEELSFMSREEALSFVKENLFDELGYTVSDDVEIYAIDHKTMQSYQDSKLAADIEEGILPYEHYTIKDTFTEADDFYIMCFTVEYNGIKLSGRDYFTISTGRQVQGAHIRVHLNRDGVFYYECSGIMQIENTETKNEKLLSAQEAIDIAYDTYSGVISTDSVILTEIAFEYASVPYNENYDQIMLVPSWIMMLKYTSADGHEWTETLSINAVTGEAIK